MTWQLAAIILVLFIGITSWISYLAINHHRWTTFRDALSAEPGIVVTSQGTRSGHYFIAGLRDPLSADPNTIAKSAGIDPAKVEYQWQPYIALHEPFVLQRSADILAPPTTVKFSLSHNVLFARGVATRLWLSEARRFAPLIPGVASFDAAGVKADDGPPDMTAIDKLRARLESRLIHFPPSSASLDARELAALDTIALEITEIREAAADIGDGISIRVHGREVLVRSNSTADEISRQRAASVRDQLVVRGISPKLFTTYNEVVAPESPQADLTRSRSVCLEVTLVTGKGK